MSITTLHLRLRLHLHLAPTPTPTRSNIAAKVNSDSGSRVPIRLSVDWIKSSGASRVLRSVFWPCVPGSAQRADVRRHSRCDRFWLERRVDGIRVDVVGHLLKDARQ